ncbi:MAG: hypothetical protein P1Q69_19670 [Candidatus Thorarchaeota archaeon]|nr:hypothetical protein [Candidatus Thorarchaeota archaeon]
MAVTLVAKVQLATMEPTVLYPVGGADEERIAMLTGVIQLVSAALDRSGDSDADACTPRFMKSDRGVIGYCKQGPTVVICEGDGEPETNDALKAVLGAIDSSDIDIAKKLDKIIHKRGKEIGDLWK